MKKRLNTKSIPTIPLVFLVMALIAATASQSGCRDNQSGSDAPVSIEEGDGGEAGNEVVDPANEEWFITKSVDGGVAIARWKQDVDLPRDLVIPTTIEGEKVVEIGQGAFSECSSLTSVVIPEGVEKIDRAAFVKCESLTSVVIPESVKEIGSSAFSICSSLTSLVIPERITEIGDHTFLNCSALTNVVIPQGVTSIGRQAFSGCSSLTNVVIPEGVTSIGNSAFSTCSSLTSVEIPESVKEIGEYTFHKCSALTNVVIPDGATSIGDGAFQFCESLTSVVIPESVKEIGGTAFRECPAKFRVYKGSYAEKWARENKNNREYETIEEGGDVAGGEAPAPCEPIPAEAASEAEEAVAANEELFITESVDGGVAITGWKQDVELPSELVIPATIEGEKVVEIGERAFYECSSLTNVVIPESVRSIGAYAFNRCSSLTSVEIPECVEIIGSSAFYVCSSLTSVVIPKGVTKIGGSAFAHCESLTSVVVPEGVKEIGSAAFSSSSAKVEVDPKNAFYSSVDGVLFDRDKKTLLHVPRNVTTYSIPDGVEKISEGALSDCKSLTSVVIPKGVTEIGRYAFIGCSSLTSVEIPESVKEIEGMAFQSCSSLTNVVIPEGITVIRFQAFRDCASLASVVIPKGVTEIGGYTFAGCRSLTSVVIPESIQKIGASAFEDCSSLTSMVIPEEVTSIETRAFSRCRSLTSVVIPKGVESIGENAFQECPAKLRVYKDSYAEKWARENNREYEIIEEGGDVAGGEAPVPCEPIPAEAASEAEEAETHVAPCAPFWMCPTPEDFFITENVDDGVAITGYKQEVGLPVVPDGIVMPPIVIPSQIGGKPVVKIDTKAFGDCSSMMSVVIPESVSSIEDDSFEGYPAKFHVFKDSYAEKWARENNREYEIIEEGGDGANNEGVAPCEPIPAGEPVPPCEPIPAGEPVPPCEPVPPSPEAATPNDEPMPVEDGSEPSASEPTENELREWTDSTGNILAKATLIGRVGPFVQLRDERGPDFTVSITRLSEKDRNYLDQLAKSAPDESESNESKPAIDGLLREWTDSTDAYRFKAYLQGRYGSLLELVGENGVRIHVTISELSEKDRKFLTPDESEPSASEPTKNELREWTDSTGKYRIKATLAEQEGSNVKLRREDGKRITMPISKLSEDDRNYLAKLTEATPIESEPSASEPTKNELREWTDSTGAYRIKATYEGQEGSNVKLRREDGKRITLPISKLSDADQDYLNKL